MTRTLLIVDDIKSNREILKNMLGGDYKIIEAEHGQEALAIMTGEYQQISAVLLDLGMPVMDGYEVLSYMQGSDKLSQLPVIVTTGQTDAGSEEKALRLGAKDYISKPYKSAIIKQRIWNTINLRETAATVNALQRDRLTGLYSRDAFFEKVREMVDGHEAGYYTMACFDVDKFKVINDQYGTEKGDEVLKYIAGVFERSFEQNGGLCCRVSSDDFAAIYPTAFQDSDAFADMRKRASLVEGLASPIVFSIGQYCVDDVDMEPSAMYDRAMLAAESLRGRYGAHVAAYDESMRDHLIREQEIVTEMETALNANQFEVWYQPQYNHSTGAMIGAEALVRWRHPERGMISPSVFVPVFEQNGFIYALDKYVWERVCQYLKNELEAGRSPLPVSVNISRYDVFRPDFVEFITGLIVKYDIPVDLLRLEITESAFAEATNHIVNMAKQLISFGFTLEIDDFGSGYSSLNTLKNVPAQVVKLDMRFFEDDDGSQRGGSIIESVVRMAKWLGMSTIAEGVENKMQADYLRSIGCNYVQGYLYAKPMMEADYRELCSKAGKEEKLLALETVENLDNNAFWNPESMDTLIFNSYVGGACIYEYHNGSIELLRATEKYAQMIGGVGMTVEDALKLNWADHLDEVNLKRVVKDLNVSIATKKEVTGEYLFTDLPGCPHETHLRSTMRVIASAGDRYLVYCTNENITAQRKAERREREITEQMKSVMDNVACGITAVNITRETVKYVLTNDKYYELLGYTKQQYLSEIGTHAFNTIFPLDRERVMNITERVKTTGKPRTMEYRAVRRDGSIVWLRSIVSMALFEGIGKVQLSTYTDITKQKQAELDLWSTTAQLRTMMDDIPGGFVRMSIERDGSVKPVFINNGFCRITGMEHDTVMEFYSNDAMAGVHPDDAEIVKAAVAKMIENGEASSARYRLRNGGGGYVWVSVFGRTTTDAAGNAFLNVYYTDVTEQVAEETQQRELLNNLPYGAALYDYDGSTLSVIHLNKRYWELVGREETVYAGEGFLSAVFPEDMGVIESELAAAIRDGRDISCDIRLLCGKGEYRPFHIAAHVQAKKEGGYSIYAAYTPISDETMSIQQMLPIALGAVMDYQTDYSFVKDKNLRYICGSREMSRIIGLSSGTELRGKTDYDIMDAALADAFSKEDRKILQSGEPIIGSIAILPSADGAMRYASTSKFPIKDSAGNVVGIYGSGRDITEERQMQSQLELLTNNIPGGLAIYEGRPEAMDKIRLTYFSNGFCQLFGYTREEYEKLAEVNPLGLVFAADISTMYEKALALVKNGVPMDYIYRAKAKNGAVKWINVRAVMGEPNGENMTVNAIFLDVTERQEALEQLRISEQENRLAMRHTSNAVCRYDVASSTIRIPEAAQANFDLPATLENLPYAAVERGDISAETTEAYIGFYEGIRRGEETGSAVFQRRSPKGWRWLEAHYSTIFSDSGAPVSAVISFVDISEQLEKDSAYKRWRQSFQNRAPESYSLFRCNISNKTSFDAREGSLLAIEFAPGVFSFDEHTQEYVSQYVFEEDRERFMAFLNADALLSGYYKGKRSVTIEYRERAGADIRWLKLRIDLVEHAHSTDIEAYMFFEDIDKIKRYELATLEQAETDPLTGAMNRNAFAARVNNTIRTARPGTQHALMMMDIDGFKMVNDAFGHGAGDQALIDIVSTTGTVLRHDDLVGRLGGDEFMMFLSDIPGDTIAATKARQICALTCKAFSSEVEISSSIGIAMIPRDGNDFDELYKKADTALYHVKGSGKNGYAFYSDDITDERREKGDEPAAAPAAVQKKKRRMLIVDDSRIDHALLTNIFTDQFMIEKAKDGSSALIRLRHYGTAISVVLLDLMMPGMDGFAVLKKMQESPELRGVPVIVVSGDDDRDVSLRAIRAGAVDFVNKPVDPDILRIRVQSAISKAENERLRAKNSLLEYQSNEVKRYKGALEHSGIVVMEHDWVAGTFIYDSSISEHIAGRYDGRGLWHILLSDFVAKTQTVQKMQELVQRIAADRKISGEQMFVQLKTPSNAFHWFNMNAYKEINEFGLAGKIYLTFIDVGAERPASK